MKSVVCRALVLAGLGIVGAGCKADPDITIAVRGRTTPYAIVLPSAPLPSEQYAAEELRDWTEKLVGVRLTIVTNAMPSLAIYLNRSRPDKSLGDDGFEIAVRGSSLLVAGGCRGILYGVYELLETYGGIQWLASDFTDIPKTSAFKIPKTLKDRQLPAFVRRCHDWHRIADRPDFAARSRENHFPKPERFGGSHPAFDARLGWCHTFNWLIRPSEYFDKHPEYFSEIKGKRTKTNSQLCLTNPDVLRIVTEKTVARVKENLRQKTGVKYYGISQNDWNGYCECTNCTVIDAREGSHAGALLAFVNKVAEEVEKVDPEAIVETLAYMYSRRPPKTIRPRHNVMPMLCSIECDFSKGMSGNRFKENVDFRSDVEKWRDISSHLMIWDYVANYRASSCPQHNIRTIQDNAKYYRDQGVTELFLEGFTCDSPSIELSALKAWLSSKMMWNPDRPLRPLVERFVNAYYGKGAPFVLKYIDLLEEQPIDETKTPFIYRIQVDEMPWSETFMKESQALWAQASAAVAGESPQVVSNVFWGAFCADYTRLGSFIHKSGKWKPFIVSRKVAEGLDRREHDEMRRLAVKVNRALEENPAAILSSNLRDFRYKGFVRAMAGSVYPEGAAIDRSLIQDWSFVYSNYPPSGKITRERDPEATDGHVLVVRHDGSGWKLTCHLKESVAMDKDATYRLRARVKVPVEKGTPGDKVLVSFGLHDFNQKKTVSTGEVRSSAATGKFEWYELSAFKATSVDYVIYLDPHDGACSLDCFEIIRQ